MTTGNNFLLNIGIAFLLLIVGMIVLLFFNTYLNRNLNDIRNIDILNGYDEIKISNKYYRVNENIYYNFLDGESVTATMINHKVHKTENCTFKKEKLQFCTDISYLGVDDAFCPICKKDNTILFNFL